ncbi:MAG: hypothetical protein AAGF95_32425 [Chloroflexota bacterium]
MIKPITQIIHLCLLAVLVLAGFVSTEPVAGASLPAQTPDESTEIVSSMRDNVQVAAPREWTMAELQAAQPYPAPHVVEGPGPGTPAPTGPAGLEQGSLPLKAPTTGAPTEAMPDDNAAQALEPEVPYTYSTFPFSTVGRLFFSRGGGDYSCSAAVIKNQSIWTAGHCLHAGDGSSTGWATNVVFVPQYRDGVAPLGQWPVDTLWTTHDWINNGFPYGLGNDVGAGILRDPIGARTGWLGFAWNQPFEQYYTPIGYPADAPYNGERMRYCPNRYFDSYGGIPGTFGVACAFTGGSSGGPWLTNFVIGTAGEMNYLNGNTSQVSNIGFSPYFGDTAKFIYDQVY